MLFDCVGIDVKPVSVVHLGAVLFLIELDLQSECFCLLTVLEQLLHLKVVIVFHVEHCMVVNFLISKIFIERLLQTISSSLPVGLIELLIRVMKGLLDFTELGILIFGSLLKFMHSRDGLVGVT